MTSNLHPSVACEACWAAGADLVTPPAGHSESADVVLTALCNDCIAAAAGTDDAAVALLAALVDVHTTLTAYRAAQARLATIARPWGIRPDASGGGA